MYIKNLSELKKALCLTRLYHIIWHRKSEHIDTIRYINVRPGNGVYSKVAGNPRCEASVCNGGQGTWSGFDFARHYCFGHTIKWYSGPADDPSSELTMEFEVLDRFADQRDVNGIEGVA